MTTDQELDAALALFNDGLARQKADRRAAKAIENAEKAKQQAAATLKRLSDDNNASAEDRAAAEAAYREAVATFNALRNGDAPTTTDEVADASETADSVVDAPESEASGSATEESTPTADATEPGTDAPADNADASST